MWNGPGVISAPLFLCIGGSVSDLDPAQEVTCIVRGNLYVFFPISSITALFFLSTPSIPIRETESCSVMHGQHFAEQDGRKKDLRGCTLVDKDLETKDVP